MLRSVVVACGTGCTLFVFLLSITGYVSRLYPEPFHGGWTYGPMIVVMGLLLVLVFHSRTFDQNNLVYRLLRTCAFVLAAIWVALALAFALAGPFGIDAGNSGVFFIAFEASRLLATAFLFLLWNVHMALNPVPDAAFAGSFTVFFGTSLFVVSLMFDGAAMMGLVIVAFVASCGLLMLAERRYTFNESSPYSVQAALRRRTEQPGPEESPDKVRAAFFLSRVLWYLFMTVFVVLAADRIDLSLPSGLFAALAALALLTNAVAMLFLVRSKPATCFAAMATPILLLCILPALLVARGTGAAPILVVALVLERHLLFYIQLPSYRVMTSMDPIRYAFFERLIPILANYVCRLLLSVEALGAWAHGLGNSMSDGLFAAVMVGAAAILVAVSVRHIVRHYPNRDEATARVPNAPWQECVEEVGRSFGLTPRETDVLGYLAQGYSKPYIAKVLCVSLATVKTHANNIYRKLGLSTHDELIDFVGQAQGLGRSEKQ